MTHAYQSVNSFRKKWKPGFHETWMLPRKWKPGLHETWILLIKFLCYDFIVWVLKLFKKSVFFSLKPNYGGGDGGLYECDSIELEFVEEKNIIVPFKYIDISNVHRTMDSLYLKLARASS